jgi:hypothetical protein
MTTALDILDLIVLAVFHVGGAVLLLAFSLWGLLWLFGKVSSAIMFRLWTTELTLRVARHLWHSTKIPPPNGWEPRPVDEANLPDDVR